MSRMRYNVVKYIVNPATKDKQCSYVELVAPEGTVAQTPLWFISHWSARAWIFLFTLSLFSAIVDSGAEFGGARCAIPPGSGQRAVYVLRK